MHHLPSPVTYREDINGLRAWAVMAVLLFHFNLPGLGAGFLGVDVFFVISGFLMTAIIVKGLERGDFSILKFYMARVRRILPALMVVITVLLALGWFWLPTLDYQALGAQSVYSLSFLSNFHFWRSAGYFDAGAHEKWLLHTWSLAVEAQFYVLFPVFLMILWKIKPQLKTLFWGLGFVFVVSLTLSVVASSWKPTVAFYLLPTRGWELAAGGLAFLIGREVVTLHKFAKSMLLAGIALWIIGMSLLDSTYAWPSGWALLPVLGTVLIILANQSKSIITVNPLTQWLGDRSYSLYLWHWPLVVALYFAGLQNDWLWIAGAIALSLLLAHASYHWVEVPTRSYLSAKSLRKEVLVIALAGLVIGVSAVSVRDFVFDGRSQEAIELAAIESTNVHNRRAECHGPGKNGFTPACTYNDNESLGAVLWGDSHAAAIIGGLELASKNYNKSFIELSFSGCPAIFDVKSTPWRTNKELYQCYKNDYVVKEKLNFLPKDVPLIMVSRFTSALLGQTEVEAKLAGRVQKPSVYFSKPYEDSNDIVFQQEFAFKLVSTACFFQETRQVYIVRPIPEISVDVPKTLSRNILFGRSTDDIKITLKEYHLRNKLVWEAQDQAAKQCGVKILDPLPYLCDDQYCYGSKNGRPLYSDDDHLSEYGNKFLVPMFEQVFSDQLAKD